MTLSAALSQGVIYYVRVLPATTTYTESGTATWTSILRVPPLSVVAVSPIDITPAFLTVSVSNGVPGATVTFAVDGGSDIFGDSLDDRGQVVGTSVPLPSLSAGDHIVHARTPTMEGTAPFTVTNPTPVYPDTPGADTDPAAVTQTGVVKWVLQDPTSGGAQYIFPINPSKMSGPYAARMFTTEHSTAPDGQALIFEGSVVGVDWAIEGTCRTQEFHDTLETFLALPKRVYLIDHLSRAWTVTLESIAWSRLPEAYNDWAFTYSLKCIIYAGPRQL